jgi:7-cyano-7-deazaguanine synthase
MKKAIVLLSGGIDSATTLYFAKKKGYKCFCLIFDYGQRHKREIKSAILIAKKVNCKYQILKINLPWKGSSLLDKKIKLPITNYQLPITKIPSTYVPARNIIFLSFALSFAESINAQAIFIGAHSQDYSGYPDCRKEFYQAFNKVISVGTKAGVEKNKIKIYTPLIQKTKAQIIRLGARLRVPFELTWSCYRGGKFPCGRCDSCYFRAKGFKEAGMEDPLISR